MAAITRQDRGALRNTNNPKIIVEEDEDSMKQHQQVQPEPSPSRSQQVSSAETAEVDICSSAKSKRPHVPYSQREIYEKKTVTTRAPPRAGPICSKRSASNTADSGSTPVRPPAASPAYSHSRNTTSPSISSTSGTAATGRSTSVNRNRTVTPMRGTGATPRGASTAPREGTGEPSHTPTAGGGRAAAATRPPLEKPQPLSRPSVDWQQQYQSPHQQNTQPMARTPTSARGHGLGYPMTGMRAPSPVPGRTVATPTSNSGTPMSARLGRAQSASRPYRPTPPQPQPLAQAKPSPAKVSSSPHVTSPSPPPGGKAHGSPVKPAASPLPLPAWNASTSKTLSPTPTTPNMPGSAGRPPRKTIDASGGGSASPAAIPASSAAKGSASPAAAMAAAAAAAVARGVISGIGQGGSAGGFGSLAAVAAKDAAGCYGLAPYLSTSSTNDCAAFRDAQPEGARSADAAAEAKLLGDTAARAAGKEPGAAGTDGGASEGQESLGLIDLDGSDSLSVCGSKAAHAGVPAKGVLLVPTPSCADGSEAGGTPGATEAERAAAAVLAGDGAAERAARHCGCAVM